MNLKLLLPTLTLSLSLSLPGLAAVRYVDLNSAQPAPPYTNWASAAQTIQDAVDAADPGDQILVTNGVYKTGAALYNGTGTSNRVVVGKPLLLSSVNGPDVTLIQGAQVPDTGIGTSAVRCVYLTSGATLIGFTLTNGATLGTTGGGGAGGVLGDSEGGAVVSNCIVTCNESGGAYGVSLYDCMISNDAAGPAGLLGGGARSCFLDHCTVVGNNAFIGGGAVSSTLIDCALNNNSASLSSGAADNCTLIRCGLTNNVITQAVFDPCGRNG